MEKKIGIDFPFTKILNWYQKNGRHDLPWRQVYNLSVKDRLYRVWIAEVMLQQTQVDRVIGYYNRFLGKYPTIDSLAATTYDELFPYYQGLGYYGRARRMIELAKAVVEKYDGIFPDDFEKLRKLPGIGAYTAQALLAFGYDKPVLAMDANLMKIFARYYFGDRNYFKSKIFPPSPGEGGRKNELNEGGLAMRGRTGGGNTGGLQLGYEAFVSQLEKQLLSSISKQENKPPLPPLSGGRTINNALMDFGALASTSIEKLDRENYPLTDCVWFQTNGSQEIVKKKTVKRSEKGAKLVVFLHENHKTYFSSHKNDYEPFLIEPTSNSSFGVNLRRTGDDRRTIQDYFSVTYGLEVSVRPSFGSGLLTPGLSNLNPGVKQPVKLFHAQIQTGKFQGIEFGKNVKENWQKQHIQDS